VALGTTDDHHQHAAADCAGDDLTDDRAHVETAA
jgi:hypothetical protein